MRSYGISHVTLAVTNIKRTKEFYEKLFETSLEMDVEQSFSLLKVGIPCWFVQWHESINDRFDEKRVGLDHIAFELKTIKELEEIVNKLNELKVNNAGIEKFAGKYPYVCFRDPDNIQTEFFINKLS